MTTTKLSPNWGRVISCTRARLYVADQLRFICEKNNGDFLKLYNGFWEIAENTDAVRKWCSDFRTVLGSMKTNIDNIEKMIDKTKYTDDDLQ